MAHKTAASSHLPLLLRAFDLTEGDILEIGTGYFSTLVLNWLSMVRKKHVYSYENVEKWYERAKKMEHEYHHVVFCKSWDDLPVDKYWGVVFIDHGPCDRRKVEIERFKDNCEYLVIHDTEPEQERHYQYSSIWHLFKYRFDDTKGKPHTTVVSNTRGLELFKTR